MSAKYSIGQMNQLANALEDAGYTPDLVTQLCSNVEHLTRFKDMLIGNGKIVLVKHTIDCDAQPFIPEGWEVRASDQLASRVTGQLGWNAANIGLFISEKQKSDWQKGHELRKELESQSVPVLPANMLDYLLANPHLNPEEWKGKVVFFWGTIYRGSSDRLYVRYLYWDGGKCHWDGFWLGSYWGDHNPAAVLAS